ncbi:MAG: RagB/SusD family nutrient uptake outer membrane protein [Bacteroidota bacterium]|nr:RagB/SusD family nutrient uptake outer membrane protein [Bacteroidota bacterium]
MKKLFYISAALLTLLFVGACKKDLLDKLPLDAVSDQTVFASVENTALFVNFIYAGLPNGFARGWYMLASAASDAENSYPWTPSHIYNRGEQTPSNSPDNNWTESYNQIKNCNVFFENIDKVPGNADLIKRLKGEVHFLRAFYYAELHKRFGGVPLITKVLTLNDNFLEDRATAEQIVDFIVKELDEAAAVLPLKYSGIDKGRATKVAALALKGRVLLYAGKFTESSTASKAAITEGEANGHGLYSPYDKIFLDNNNREVIFDKQLLAKNFSGQHDLFNTPVGYANGWGGTCPTQNFVDAYEMKTTGKPITDPASGYDPTNPYAGRDLRFEKSVLYNGTMWKGRPVDTKENGADKPNGNGDATKTGYYMRKFLDESVNAQSNLITGSQNWILIRLGEIYLNYAEAQLKLNNADEARTWVNKIRTRAAMPNIPAGEMTWERYMNERRVELSFEEHRFWDVRRWKVAEITENEPVFGMKITNVGGVLTYTKYKWEDRKFDKTKHYLFPIPQSERDKNPNLSQNPGW